MSAIPAAASSDSTVPEELASLPPAQLGAASESSSVGVHSRLDATRSAEGIASSVRPVQIGGVGVRGGSDLAHSVLIGVVAVDDVAARGATGAARVVRVWDLPLRIFHWSLAAAVVAAYVTAEFGGSEWMSWHGRIGTFVLALLVFRLVWGFIGTRNARFGSFLPTPSRVSAYLKGRWQGLGHSPLGALSVIALLSLAGAQAVTGLLSNDDIAFAGPLSKWVDKLTSDRLTGWHAEIFNFLAAFVILHVVAILFYLLVRKTNLISAMVTGRKPVTAPLAEDTSAVKNLGWRFAAAVLVAATVSWLAWQEPAADLTNAPVNEAEAAAAPAATADW